jgi:photosystem II stability/assembly factor-like uncharacterized protein
MRLLFLALLTWSAAQATFAQTWTNASPPGNAIVVACSADGSTIFVFPGEFISTNCGASWTSSEVPVNAFSATCSANGGKVYVGSDSEILISTNLGVTWMTNHSPSGDVRSIACSANGSRVAVADMESSIFYSADGGTTFTGETLPTLEIGCVAMSSDGSKLIASISQSDDGSPIYRSVDSGMTWTQTAPVTRWDALTSSADGTKLAAVGGFYIWTSTNSGLTWVSNRTLVNYPELLASSADGTVLATAPGYGISGPICISLNSGGTWTTNNSPSEDWLSIAMSADGSEVLACGSYNLYVAHIPAQPSLSIAASGSNVVLSWPLPSTGFVLQASGDLTSTNWAAVTNSVTATNYWNQVTLTPPATGNVFYRLANP